MSLAETTEPNIGHNQPEKSDAYLTLEQRLTELLPVGNRWITERPTFETEEIAKNANDYLSLVTAFKKAAADLHKKEKAPFLEGGRVIDAQKKALVDPIEAVEKIIKDRRTAYLVEQKRIKDEKERKAREEEQKKLQEAEKARRDAAAALEAANAGDAPDVDVIGLQQKAEIAEQEAEQASQTTSAIATAKPQIAGTYGNKVGLREEWSAEITNYDAALTAFKENDEVKELVQKIANQLARSPASRKMTYPGIKFVSKPKS